MTTMTSPAARARVGFRTITPFIIHGKAPELVDFLKTTFGAEELKRNTAGEAYGFYSELRIGDTVIMIGGGTAARRSRSLTRFCISSAALLVNVTARMESAETPLAMRLRTCRTPLGITGTSRLGCVPLRPRRVWEQYCRLCIPRARATTSISSSEPSTPKSWR